MQWFGSHHLNSMNVYIISLGIWLRRIWIKGGWPFIHLMAKNPRTVSSKWNKLIDLIPFGIRLLKHCPSSTYWMCVFSWLDRSLEIDGRWRELLPTSLGTKLIPIKIVVLKWQGGKMRIPQLMRLVKYCSAQHRRQLSFAYLSAFEWEREAPLLCVKKTKHRLVWIPLDQDQYLTAGYNWN